jgi:hypothetical protein
VNKLGRVGRWMVNILSRPGLGLDTGSQGRKKFHVRGRLSGYALKVKEEDYKERR